THSVTAIARRIRLRQRTPQSQQSSPTSGRELVPARPSHRLRHSDKRLSANQMARPIGQPSRDISRDPVALLLAQVVLAEVRAPGGGIAGLDRKSTRLNS